MPSQTAGALPANPPVQSRWRHTHIGQVLSLALQRFDARVLALMTRNIGLPLALSHLAARGRLGAAHSHITRHLATEGARLTDLAQQAGMSKQAMGKLVDECEAWGMVMRAPDPRDARAKRVLFTADGLAWLKAYGEAVAQAEDELRAAIGSDVATVVAIGLEAYAA